MLGSEAVYDIPITPPKFLVDSILYLVIVPRVFSAVLLPTVIVPNDNSFAANAFKCPITPPAVSVVLLPTIDPTLIAVFSESPPITILLLPPSTSMCPITPPEVAPYTPPIISIFIMVRFV